ncbi:Cysteine desulfuration protein SufE [Vibrio stylophorae]|uniref:Cysteine desulfuration protein SufE n=1 Tax=Vibrio stylophorae TaxID=659351 RepID=A0ABM8ZY13_9VIBR|nr:SufE family protein [Vibrio stylophorae]CAH0535748.1 Cysteine desulfuration protein SufE [Vibrio stylophorae]
MTPEKITTNFSRCMDWQERYQYLIELGQRFATMDATDCTQNKRIDGCQSQVWLDCQLNAQGQVAVRATSDAAIVRGLLALVIIAYDGQTPAQAMQWPMAQWLSSLGLAQHLSPSRTQGLYAVIEALHQQLAKMTQA